MNKASTEQQAWRVSMEIGRQSFQKGRLSDAVNAFRQAATLQPGRVEGWVNLGSALLETGRFEAAVSALGKATELKPRLGAAHMLLGDAFRQLGDFKVALRSYRTAVALQRSPLTLNKLACALRVEGQSDEAGELYREAIRLDPNFSLARVNLATLQIETGQFDDARAQLAGLDGRALPPHEQQEVLSSQQALAEYVRLRDAIDTLNADRNPGPLRDALLQSPPQALGVDESVLTNIRRYLQWTTSQDTLPAGTAGSPPAEWPLIESLFMIPVIGTPDEYLEIRAQLDQRETATSDLAESFAMEAAIETARTCRDEMADAVLAELHLRHWHALACTGVDGFMPGHFKYTQNWSTRNPTLKRVDPAQASGTLRQFVTELHATLEPGLPRAAIAFMGLCDLHPFADGNGRIALTWMNRELEWAGLMPVVFRRDMGLKGELGKVMKEVRVSGGDLSPLLELLGRGQLFTVEFCTSIAAC